MKIALNTAHRPPLLWPAGASFAAHFAGDAYSRAGMFVPPVSAFSLARSTKKWAQGARGEWHQFAAHHPAITDLGLSVETQSTNLVPNAGNWGAAQSATDRLDGLPAGWNGAKFDGTTVCGRVLGTGNLLGLPALVIRLWGDAAVGDAEIRWFAWGSLSSNIEAVQGDELLVSLYVQRVAGSMAGVTPRMRITERDASGAYLVKQIRDISPGPEPARLAHVFTISDAHTARTAAGFEFAFDGAFDVTLAVAAVQIEKNAGTDPSSPIITYGAPDTRAADSLTLHLPDAPTALTLEGANGRIAAMTGKGGGTVLDPTGLPDTTIRSIIGYPD